MAFISSQFCTFYSTYDEDPAYASAILQTTLLRHPCLKIPSSCVISDLLTLPHPKKIPTNLTPRPGMLVSFH